MSKYKIIDYTFFHLALLATISPHSPSLASAQVPSSNKTFSEAILLGTKVGNRNWLKPQYKEQILPTSQNKWENSILVADSDLTEDGNNTAKPQDRLLKIVLLSLFMLFFVPLGIFYPLFLFYRKLLINPNEPDDSLKEDRRFESTQNSLPLDLDFVEKDNIDTSKATVSKLQIAFSPTANYLRRQLAQLSSDNGVKDIVELMRRFAALSIAQDCWTHVNCSSTTLPSAEIRMEFDLVSSKEKSKFNSKDFDFISRNSEINNSRINKNYSYVVVTLILCTTHDVPLFEPIFTKKQLTQELIKLSKMRKDRLIEFELLWNPQEENSYISNDRLLVEYGEMIRLL